VRDLSAFNLLGGSDAFLRAVDLVQRFAASSATILIQGETGTGKELAARAIHYLHDRRRLPFVPVNCAALPETLAESELFGHTRGAFTDAREARQGLIRQACNGTLFLDEIEAMPLRTQAVLLRFLQDKEFRSVGGGAPETSAVRVIGATNADLVSLVKRGAFRADLLFRLKVLSIELPPLRERAGDVALLARAFVARLNDQTDSAPVTLAGESIAVLEAYGWPGNVRELENLIQRLYILAGAGGAIRVSPRDLAIDPDELGPGADCHGGGNLRGDNDGTAGGPVATAGHAAASACAEAFKVAKARAVAQFEKSYIEALLVQTSGNISLASRLSGKDRSDIGKLARKHGIRNRSWREGTT